MKIALRALVLLIVFAVVGWMAAHATLSHAIVREGAYRPETKLAAMMAALFAGGAAVVVVAIGMVLTRKKSDSQE